jgi:type I restriction enzyme S subunit
MEQQVIPQGYKQTEVGVIPEDWDIVQLKDICLFENGDRSSNYPSPSSFVENGIPFINAGHVSEGVINSEAMNFITDKAYDKLGGGKVKSGDILFCLRGSLGKFGVVPESFGKGAIASSLVIVRSRNNKILLSYLVSGYLKSKICVDMIELWAGGAAQPNLGANELGKFLVPLPPSIKEQTAIATTLSDVDSLITSLDKLIAKKQAIKTATMQQLLTGKTRLPAFSHHPDGQAKGTKQSDLGEIPEDWDIDRIGSVLSITTGDKNTQDKIDDGLYPFFVRSQTIERINSYSFDGEAVLTAGDGVGTGKIFHYIKGKCDYHQRVYLMHNFGEKVHGYYFYIYFSNHFYDRIMSMTAKSSVDSVRREMIADMLIALPLIDEQREIAKVLSDMDTEIQTLQQRLSKTQQLKQGMMQELLTGKTRLPLN